MKPIVQQLDLLDITSETGAPDGGRYVVNVPGHRDAALVVRWQRGPLIDPETKEELPPNGLFLATLVRACIARLSYYQESRFRCAENAEALELLQQALNKLDSRAVRREVEGTLGTHEVDQNPKAE